MSLKRNQHRATFNPKVALAAMQYEKTIAQLSRRFGVDLTMDR
jgi:hypothetical protein